MAEQSSHTPWRGEGMGSANDPTFESIAQQVAKEIKHSRPQTTEEYDESHRAENVDIPIRGDEENK